MSATPVSPATDQEDFYREFTTTVLVTRYDGTDTVTTSSSGSVNGSPTVINTGTDLNLVPDVTASFEDPGITIIAGPGEFIISGTYVAIHPVPVEYISLDTREVATGLMPISTSGVYEKIVSVTSPPLTTIECTYTAVSFFGSATTVITTTTSTRVIGTSTVIISTTTTSTSYTQVEFVNTFTHKVIFRNYSTVSDRILDPLLQWQPGP
jgi:hypothetical protein